MTDEGMTGISKTEAVMRNYIHVNNDETIQWEGKPDRRVSVFEAIFNPLLPFALIWLLFDGTFIVMSRDAMMSGEGRMLYLPFFALHLMPVWIYLFGVITAGLKAKNTRYVVTDRAIYIQKGIFTVTTERSPLNEVNHTGIHIGIIDRMFGTGDVVTECVHDTHRIENIRDFDDVCDIISRTSQDQYTDAMYPNDMRPDENHGYNTKYVRR